MEREESAQHTETDKGQREEVVLDRNRHTGFSEFEDIHCIGTALGS